MNEKTELLEEFDPLSEQNKEFNKGPQILAQQKDNMGSSNSDKSESSKKISNEDPLFDFQLFTKDFKDPRAEPLVKYTKSFLHNFSTQRELWTATEQTKLIEDFKMFIYEKLSVYEPFKGLDRNHLNNAEEGIEKLIMGKLYSRCFSPDITKSSDFDKMDEEHKIDIMEDKLLQDKTNEYKFIELGNLDVTDEIATTLEKFIKLASRELNKVNSFKAPRDKMVCILNLCKVIFGILKHFKLDKNGADTFIPLLIYVLVKGDTKHLISNIRYIERFRYKEFLKSEDEYYLSSLQGAANFVINLNREKLTITDSEEFEKKYEANKKMMKITKKEETIPVIKTPSDGQDLSSASPLEDLTSSMFSMFNDLFIGQGTTETVQDYSQRTMSNSSGPDIAVDHDKHINKIIKKLEVQEREDTFTTLCGMFPDLPTEIIEDVCIAKKYRVGVCVDTLLTLYD